MAGGGRRGRPAAAKRGIKGRTSKIKKEKKKREKKEKQSLKEGRKGGTPSARREDFNRLVHVGFPRCGNLRAP